MVRFTLVDKESWDRWWVRWDPEKKIYLCAEFDEPTNREITNQMCNGDAPDFLRACCIELEYNVTTETLRICDAALQQFDPKTGKDTDDRPFGNDEWVEAITLPMNQDEVNYIKEHLEEIIAQIEENERNAPPYEESEWDYDYLR